jgi:hypothetical protein
MIIIFVSMNIKRILKYLIVQWIDIYVGKHYLIKQLTIISIFFVHINMEFIFSINTWFFQ